MSGDRSAVVAQKTRSFRETPLLLGTNRRESYLVATLTLGLFGVYAIYSLSRHTQGLTSGYDLGIFSQVVAAYANLEAPIAPLKGYGFHILGDHFHPILALLAPFWVLFPSPESLLVAQAALVASSIIPIWLFTRSRLAVVPSLGIALAYALSWPIQGMIDFDFHEVAFSIPILAWAIYLFDKGKYGLSLATASALLLVREDMFILVLVFAFLLAFKKKFILSLIAVLISLASYVVVMKLIIPAFSPSGDYLYWSLSSFGDSPLDAFIAMATDPIQTVSTLFFPAEKSLTLLLLLAPVAFFSVFSPYFLFAVPLFAQRFLSDREVYWGTEFHYSAIFAPILFIAAVDGFSRLYAIAGRSNRIMIPKRRAENVFAGYCVVFVIMGIAFSSTLFPFQRIITTEAFQPVAKMPAIERAVDLVPKGVCVEADQRIVPHLLPDRIVALPTWLQGRATWLILDYSTPEPGGVLAPWLREETKRLPPKYWDNVPTGSLPPAEEIAEKAISRGWIVESVDYPIVVLRSPNSSLSGCGDPV